MTQGYTQHVKDAVIAALLAGQSVSSVAEEYDIPRGTVGRWSADARRENVSPVSNDKKEQIGDLLIGYLHANLTALQAQAQVFADPDWLEKQEASELAVLHGVMTDKAVRLLEALTRAGFSD